MTISAKNPRYRTLEKLAEDMAYVLNAPLAYGTKHATLHEACWVWTQFNGKYRGCRRWTKLAVQLCGKAYRDGLRRKCEGLVHEHAVPKKVVIKFLHDLESPTPESVRQICEQFLFGVVISKVEDAMLNVYYRDTMPSEFFVPTSPEYHDPFLRYKRCQLEILSLRDNWWLDIPHQTNESAVDGQPSITPLP